MPETATKPRKKSQWKQDPEAVKAEILQVATEEFAMHGLAGARIDEIARRTSVSKRMIYYYFGDKLGLYIKALEAIYAALRSGEEQLRVETMGPVAALQKLVEATFDTHFNNPNFVRLVMIENIHQAQYLKSSDAIPKLNRAIIVKLQDVCRRGKEAGIFHDDTDPVELHWFISSFSFYNISNRATFSVSFGDVLFSADGQRRLKQQAVDMILARAVKGYQPGQADHNG
jgi:AcrR family transcriptional regulator